jgi:hypothetical protein
VLLQGTKDQIPPWQAAKAQDTPWYDLMLMLGGPKGFNLLPTYATLFWVYLFTVLTLVVVYRLKMSSSGRAFLSIREDEIAAQAMGVDITRNKVARSGFPVSRRVAGGLYAMYIGTISVRLTWASEVVRHHHHGGARRSRFDLRAALAAVIPVSPNLAIRLRLPAGLAVPLVMRSCRPCKRGTSNRS